MILTLYDSYGNVKARIEPDDSSTQEKEIQGDNLLNLSFTLYEFIPIDVNDYIDYEGERYRAVEKYVPAEKSSVEWEYGIRLYGIESLIKRFLVLNNTDGGNEAVFTLTARPIDHVRLIVKNINDGMDGTTNFKTGTVEGTDNVTIDYTGKYCNDGLKELAEAVGVEWWIEGETVNLCRCEHGEEITLGYDKGLTALDRDKADNAKFYTRLFPIGSSRNIDAAKYGHSRLMLPDGVKYVDVNVERYGIIHHYEQKAFADIYPRRVGVVAGVRSKKVKDKDGKPFMIYYFKDNDLSFDPNDYEIGGLVKRVSFQEGSELAGLGAGNDHYFEVNYDSKTKEFEIITIWPYDDDTQLPGGTLVPKEGDKYILWNIRMPDEYYGLAEKEFGSAVDEYNKKHALDVSRYKAPTDHVWMEETGTEVYVGSRIRLESKEYFPEKGFRASRITKIIRKVNEPGQMDLEISDALSKGSMARIDDAITDAKNYAGTLVGSINVPDIIRSWDRTKPTDSNLYSARRTHKEFMSRLLDDTARGLITFLKGIAFGKGKGIDGDGNAMLGSVGADDVKARSVSSPGYTGADIVSDTGFKMWEDAEGRSHVITDFFTARVKAFFASLEIRKIEHSAGNRIESPAGNTISRVDEYCLRDPLDAYSGYVKVEERFHGKTYWKKLAHIAGRFFGITKRNESNAPVVFYRCYFTAEDEEKGITNDWRVGDQAYCETFNLRKFRNDGTAYGVTNKRYWRLVIDAGYEIIDGVEHGYIDLCNQLAWKIEEGGDTLHCVGYENVPDIDVPAVGDDVACFGSQTHPETRGGALQYITCGGSDTSGIPCVRMFSGINGYDLSRHVIKESSPKREMVRADKFEILSASGTGEYGNITCFRGDWRNGVEYGHYDVVLHLGSSWLCTVPKGTATTEEPSKNASSWVVFAARGGTAPVIYCDTASVVLDMDSEGQLRDPYNAPMPTRFSMAVDGTKIEPSLLIPRRTYVEYKNRRVSLNGKVTYTASTEEDGLRVRRLTLSTDEVNIEWKASSSINGDGREHPTPIILHAEFVRGGDTLSAELAIPVIEQRAPATVLAEYSVTGEDGTWHAAFAGGDVFAHYSYDGGRTWTPKIRIVGKSLEFKTAVKHFATWSDYQAGRGIPVRPTVFLVDKKQRGAVSPIVVTYRAGNFQQGVPPYENVAVAEAGDKYFTSADGHLWNSQGQGKPWLDMGRIEGAAGTDGVSFVLSPATVIFEQDEKTLKIDTRTFAAHVIGMSGTRVLSAGRDYKIARVDGVHCNAVANGDRILIESIGKDAEGRYYSSGSVTVTIKGVGSQEIALTLNWAANLLGTWKQTVKNDVMQAVSEKTVTYNDADGNMHTEKLETLIAQNANGVSISAKVNDLERAGIHLNGKDSRIDLLAEHTRFLAPTGLPFIKIGMDEQGVPYLVFMMPDGVTPAYNLGYTGLTQIINDSVKAGFGTPLRLRYLGILEDLEEGISAEKLFKACDPYGMAAYFRFTQSRVRQADGTLQLVPGGVDVDGKYYDSNAMSANSLPTGRTLNECCGSSVITQQVYTLWISDYTSQQGWQNSPGLNPPTWITRKFLIYYVKDSRIVKNTSLSVEFSVINGKNVYSVQPWQGTDPGIYVPADV